MHFNLYPAKMSKVTRLRNILATIQGFNINIDINTLFFMGFNQHKTDSHVK